MDVLGGFTIPVQSLGAGNHRFEFEVDDLFFDAFEGSPVTGGKAHVDVDALKSASGLTLHFQIEGEVTVVCDRCLEPLTLPVDYRGELAVRTGDGQEQGEYDGDTLWIGSRDATVDVAQYIYESICLSLPIVRVHGTDAGGVSLCDADMLSRFRIVSQDEFDEIAKEKNERNPLQEELEKIKTTDK